jgi:competence protein ComEC
VRSTFANRLRNLFDEQESALTLGYLVGERSDMSEEMQSAIRIVGLSHMVVVSGFHLSLVVEWEKRLLGKVSRIAVVVGSIILILFFISITGMSASMMRAGLMTILSLIAWYYGRKFHPARLLLYIAAISLIPDPHQVFNVAWQLSFASFAGIVFVSPVLTRFLYGERHKPGFIASSIIASISAQMCCLPITIYNFGAFSIVGIFATLLITPTVPIIMSLATLSAVIEPIKFLAKPLIDFNLFIISSLSENSWAVFDAPTNNALVFLIYLPIIALFFWLKHRTKYDFRPRYTLDKSRKYGKIYTC